MGVENVLRSIRSRQYPIFTVSPSCRVYFWLYGLSDAVSGLFCFIEYFVKYFAMSAKREREREKERIRRMRDRDFQRKIHFLRTCLCRVHKKESLLHNKGKYLRATKLI